MEARRPAMQIGLLRPTWSQAAILLFMAISSMAMCPSEVLGQRSFQVSTDNFVVIAPDPNLARKVANEAERYRVELSELWLGKQLEPWRQKCPIEVELAMHAGGETSFAFIRENPRRSIKGVPIDWRMKIFGPPDRVVDSVLPHEITHTIFATHFGQPLPRWADEGACTTVEHESERAKNHQMLLDFLLARPSRGIPFNRMFTMRKYPHDILPLYAQGHSLAQFMLRQKGRRHFVRYVEAGLDAELQGNPTRAWGEVTQEFYGYENLSDLQLSWLAWVKDGSPMTPLTTNPSRDLMASTSDSSRSNSNQLIATPSGDRNKLPRTLAGNPGRSRNSNESSDGELNLEADGWYAKQMKIGKTARIAARRESSPKWQPSDEERSAKQSDRIIDSRLPAELRNDTIWR